ncbi:MAG: hypothetical protein [Wendovervirus sonii]|uniref:Uncharacterized protein n=1 Tax=phage Lak_Megaphage_Sonny TaxID=3109229 RepID=A0ABZ0Z2N4_9CAUD|nr:MAG: hypothetical protein [phage Lak_Megaphage_Sonny]
MSYNEKQVLGAYIKSVTSEINIIRRFAEDNNLLHEQIYINFEDFLNKISTMDPADRL